MCLSVPPGVRGDNMLSALGSAAVKDNEDASSSALWTCATPAGTPLQPRSRSSTKVFRLRRVCFLHSNVNCASERSSTPMNMKKLKGKLWSSCVNSVIP